METAEITRNYILYFVLPFWLAVGFADYLCHRRARIERTSGIKESALHLLMLTEMGIPIVLGLYLEVTSLVILIMMVAFVLHEATALWDVAYAETRRDVSLFEQHVHSYLAVVPFMVGSFVICLYWPEFLGLLGLGPQADFTFRLKQPPLPVGYHIGMSIGVLVFLVLPYTNEMWRCIRNRRELPLDSVAARSMSVVPGST